jgi:hypothetical protein
MKALSNCYPLEERTIASNRLSSSTEFESDRKKMHSAQKTIFQSVLSFNSLEDIAAVVETNSDCIIPFVDECKSAIYNLYQGQITERINSALIDYSCCKPVRVKGDHNCLYNSISV